MGALLGDKAYDSNWIIDALNQRGTKVVISQMPQRTSPVDIDLEMYKWQHMIENLLPPFGRCIRPCKLKEFKCIAMRKCKTDQKSTALIQLCSAVINSR